MSDLQIPPKPHPDISDYEWERTPTTVKKLIDSLQVLLEKQEKQIEDLEAENLWFRQELNKDKHVPKVSAPEAILWATIGLILTIAGTLIPASTIVLPWHWQQQGITLQGMSVTYQIAAVLLTACLGGKYAGLLSQVAYVVLGLTGLPIFSSGGGLDYWQKPSFGYILGFIFAAWLCGYLAFKTKAKFYTLAGSCLAGLFSIHLFGIVYLIIVGRFIKMSVSITEGIMSYSVEPLLQQLALVCAVIAIAFSLRKMLFS